MRGFFAGSPQGCLLFFSGRVPPGGAPGQLRAAGPQSTRLPADALRAPPRPSRRYANNCRAYVKTPCPPQPKHLYKSCGPDTRKLLFLQLRKNVPRTDKTGGSPDKTNFTVKKNISDTPQTPLFVSDTEYHLPVPKFRTRCIIFR